MILFRYRYNWIRKTCHRFECADDGKKWMSIGRFYMMQTGRPLCLVVRSWISHGLSDHSLTIWSRCFSEERKQDSRRWARIFIDDIKRSSMSLVKACELGLSHRDHKWDAWLILWGKSFRIWLNMSVTSIVKHFLTLHPRCECSWFYTIVWCREASFCRTGVLIGSWWRMLRDLGSCHWGKDTVLPVSDIRKWLGGWVVHKDIHEIWMTQWPILKWVYHGLSMFFHSYTLDYKCLKFLQDLRKLRSGCWFQVLVLLNLVPASVRRQKLLLKMLPVKCCARLQDVAIFLCILALHERTFYVRILFWTRLAIWSSDFNFKTCFTVFHGSRSFPLLAQFSISRHKHIQHLVSKRLTESWPFLWDHHGTTAALSYRSLVVFYIWMFFV